MLELSQVVGTARHVGKKKYGRNLSEKPKAFFAAVALEDRGQLFGDESLSDAMAGAKKIFVLHERRETLRLRMSKKRRRGGCPHCKRDVEWFTTSEAAKFSKVSEREVFRLVEAERVHFLEVELQSLLICRLSLENLSQN